MATNEEGSRQPEEVNLASASPPEDAHYDEKSMLLNLHTISGSSDPPGSCHDSYTCGEAPGRCRVPDIGMDSTVIFEQADEPFLDDLVSILDGDPLPNDLAFDPIEQNIFFASDTSHSSGHETENSRDPNLQDLDSLLDIVDAVGTASSASSVDLADGGHNWTHNITHPMATVQLMPAGSYLDPAPLGGSVLSADGSHVDARSTGSQGCYSATDDQQRHFVVMSRAGQRVGELTLLSQHADGADTALEQSGGLVSGRQRACTGAVTSCWPGRQQPPAIAGEDETSVSSTQPDFPAVLPEPSLPSRTANATDLTLNSNTNDNDPYFPLSPLEVILMSLEGRFMHLVQRMHREYPQELRRFMLQCAGERGINHTDTASVMSVKSMLELKTVMQSVQPMDVLQLERIITEQDQSLQRHENIIKEILRISCQGDMSLWEEKLFWGKVELKRLKEYEASGKVKKDNPGSGNSSSVLKGCQIESSFASGLFKDDDCLDSKACNESSAHDITSAGLDVGDDDVSVVSHDSDIEPDQTELPHDFCYPKEPDLLRSNRDVAHPHQASAVSGSVCQTQFGKVKFSVYPGIRWGRDPFRKKKRLERKLAESSKCDQGLFICDDLLDDLDMEASADMLVDTLVQHNTQCSKAAEWRRNAAYAAMRSDQCSTGWLTQPATSHLLIRKLSADTPFGSDSVCAPRHATAGDRTSSGLPDGRGALSGVTQVPCMRQLLSGGNLACRSAASSQPPPYYSLRSAQHGGLAPASQRPGVHCGSVLSEQEISRASRMAKEILNKQTRELCRSGMLVSSQQSTDFTASLFESTATSQRKPGRTIAAAEQLQSTGGGHGSATSVGTGPVETPSYSCPLWSTLVKSSLPVSHGRSSVGSMTVPAGPARKRALDISDNGAISTPVFVHGPTSKMLHTSQLPTILLQGIPILSVNRKGTIGWKGKSTKPPLLLPKPCAPKVTKEARTGAIPQHISRPRRASADPLIGPMSYGCDMPASPAFCNSQTTSSSVIPLELGRIAEQDADDGLNADRGVRSDRNAGPPCSVDREEAGSNGTDPPSDQLSAAAGDANLATLAMEDDALCSKRKIVEPPSPKSLQARDKILRAMVSLPDEEDDTAMHYHPPGHFDLISLEIGQFQTERAGGRHRLKVIYSTRKIIYEFEYPPPSEQTATRHTVHIEMKFSSVIALQSTAEQLTIVVSEIPGILVVKQPPSQQHRGVSRASDVAHDQKLAQLIQDDLTNSPMHLLRLTTGTCQAARRTLANVSQRFHQMLRCSLQLNGCVPRWKLVPATESASIADPSRGHRASQESGIKWMRPDPGQTCSCRFSCRTLDCACSRASLPCGYGGSRCGCSSSCGNTFNTLLEENIDVESAREDTCLVQNVFAMSKARDIRRLLSSRQACPHCHLLVKIRDVVPIQQPCPHCAKPVLFSWCQRRLRTSRNHCLVCIGCSEVNFRHCLTCKSCTRRSQPRGPCSQCASRRAGGESWRGQQHFVTPEAWRCSEQLMVELNLKKAAAQTAGHVPVAAAAAAAGQVTPASAQH